MFNVSVTRLRVRSFWYLPLFMLHTLRSSRQARQSEGILNLDLRAEPGRVFWTMTVWTETEAMRRYRSSGAHQVAMRILSSICNEAAYTRWTQETPELPTWAEAHRRMLAEGHLSKVKHPSRLHQSGKTAPPLEPQPLA